MPALTARAALTAAKPALSPSEGTQTGKLFRLRGKGVRSVRSSATGDLICRVTIETPVNLTRQQKDLLREFGESLAGENGKHSPRASSWLDGVKKFFDDMKFP